MKRNLILTGAICLAALCLGPASAPAARFQVQAGPGSRIVFESKAPLESFEGKTGSVGGWLEADLDNLQGEVSFEIAVDLADFDTGIKKRNQHMRENHLQTDLFPRAWLRGGTILSGGPGGLAPGAASRIEILAELDLHGVRKELALTVGLRRPAPDRLVVEAEFPVALSDFAIERPRFLVMKLADEQKVTVALEMEESP